MRSAFSLHVTYAFLLLENKEEIALVPVGYFVF